MVVRLLKIFLISVFLIFSNLAFGKYISFLDPKSELIISKYLGKKFLIGKANYSFLFWDIYDAELYSTSNKYNSNELAIILKYNRSIDKEHESFDQEFNELFFNIWLRSNSKNPNFTKTLLGQ